MTWDIWSRHKVPTVKILKPDVLIGSRVHAVGDKAEVSVELGLRLVAAGQASWVGSPPELDSFQRDLAASLERQHRPKAPPAKKPTGYEATIRSLGPTLIVDGQVIGRGDCVTTDDPRIVARLVAEGSAEIVEASGTMPPDCIEAFRELSEKTADKRRRDAKRTPPPVDPGQYLPTLTPVGSR